MQEWKFPCPARKSTFKPCYPFNQSTLKANTCTLQENTCEQVTIGFGFISDLITKEVTQVFQPTPQDLSGKKLGNLVKIMTIYALLYMKKIQTYNDEHASIFLPGSTAPKEWNNCNEDSSGNHNLGSWCIWNRICNGDIVSMFNKSPGSNCDQHTTKHLAQIWQLKLNLTRGRHGGIIVKNVSDSVAIILDKLKKNS